MNHNRRKFLKNGGMTALGLSLVGFHACQQTSTPKEGETSSPKIDATVASPTALFEISLAQWSLHRALQSGKINTIDFASIAKNDYGIGAVEYVNQFFAKRARDKPFLREMKKRAEDNGVKNLLIMVDGEGPLAHPDNNIRQEAIKNHYQWVEAAHLLGCHSIRVNCAGEGSAEDMGHAGLDGLATLSDFAKDFNINIIVENHGGNSSNGKWLADVVSRVRMPNCGTLPDFGNFCVQKKKDDCVESYDKYTGVKELLPYAKAVSAKSYDFDEQGNETTIDYQRMMQMVKDSGYKGYIGIEYEGNRLSEEEGIKATKTLLERVFKNLS